MLGLLLLSSIRDDISLHSGSPWTLGCSEPVKYFLVALRHFSAVATSQFCFWQPQADLWLLRLIPTNSHCRVLAFIQSVQDGCDRASSET